MYSVQNLYRLVYDEHIKIKYRLIGHNHNVILTTKQHLVQLLTD